MAQAFAPQYSPDGQAVEPLSMLDSDGRLADGAEPDLDEEGITEALRLMMLGRAFDRKCLSLQRQGRLGTFAPIFGQEATLVGVAMALDPSRDWAVPQYRELPVQIRQGLPLENVALYRRGHPDGGVVPDGVRMFATQVSLAAQLPHAVGLAWGLKMKGEDGVAAVFLRRRRIVGRGFPRILQPRRAGGCAGAVRVAEQPVGDLDARAAVQTAGADFASRAPSYGFPGVKVDGNDLFAVHKAAAMQWRGAAPGAGRRSSRPTPTAWGCTPPPTTRRAMSTPRNSNAGRRGTLSTGYGNISPRRDIRKAARARTGRPRSARRWSACSRRPMRIPRPTPRRIYEHVFATPTQTLERQRAAHLGEA